MRVSKTIQGMSLLVLAGLLLGSGVDIAWGQCEATEFAQVMASDWARYRHLGRSVSISGDTAVAGAYPDDSEQSAPGWAYVYQRNHGGAGNWGEVAILSASDGADGDKFGQSVSISGDTIVVGAYEHDISYYSGCGTAYVFERDAGGPDTWGQVAKLMASDAAANDNLGYAVAIDGDTIVVGARNEDVEGAAYVFVKPPTGWTDGFETAKFKAADPIRNEKFGAAAAISGDTIVIGDYNTPGNQAIGAAYVFEKPPGGWVNATETAKLTASDGAANDSFGWSVAMDGDRVLVGAPQDDDLGDDSGSAYIFEMPPGGWVNMTETVKLTAVGGVASENFGESVSIVADMALIGLPQYWSGGIGAGCAFVFDGSSWVEEARLLPSDGEAYDGYAHSLCLSGDHVVIGATEWDYNPGGVQGRVVGAMYVFAYLSDCNSNDVLDVCDVVDGTLHDDDGDGTPDECECIGDLDGDGDIDLTDLAILLAHYGMASGAQYEDGDLDGDEDVDLTDLAMLLSVYGTNCW
jgi:hypothetical protein